MRNKLIIIKRTLFIFFILGCFKVSAQNNSAFLGETSVLLIHPFTKKYSVDFTVRSRYFLYEPPGWIYYQQQVDVYHFSNYIINNKNVVSLGVYYRNRDVFDTGRSEIRLTEKYNYITHNQQIRYRHKIRIEQRFLEDITIFRQRYLFEVGTPLNGDTFDVGETYLTGSIEGLLSLSPNTSTTTSLRTNALVAWKISTTFKVRAGLEYRLNAFNEEAYSRLYFLTSAVLLL
ncbi:DUF2490 domain-containing protein [Tamlana sp. 2_MG-2023]|uniref:DUF2490 domain-containing protein n=1 Tax=unclassified Tamlana TaxID=2614803 RepID=UPI0026E34BE3|nr:MULTISPECIES: DUF2490 domain-containing protein [unclassified Tamlana]MDO6760604.1 DUF2490 domain-containing protein [Tamlana sp. 2_MG-2023]MDO6790860.1 DUF2490 domain-containing protein [Tamlana sp. 1_MG-2023]